ncbi:MAG: hypothetical protein ACYC27_06085 [Armatimonadota bacterium]
MQNDDKRNEPPKGFFRRWFGWYIDDSAQRRAFEIPCGCLLFIAASLITFYIMVYHR